MKNISVLIKPASGACNMTCDYCFYCDEAAKREQKFYGMMSEETLKNMIRRTMLHSEGSVSYRGHCDEKPNRTTGATGPGIKTRKRTIGKREH